MGERRRRAPGEIEPERSELEPERSELEPERSELEPVLGESQPAGSASDAYRGARPRPAGARSLGALLAGACDVVAIGASTGGPEALARLLAGLGTAPLAPLLVVQHLPAGYGASLAQTLARASGLDVREAEHGELLGPGCVRIAPGGHHLRVERARGGVRTVLDRSAPVLSCRPAVDVLFRSVAEVHGSRALALLLTGMGQDGLAGAREVRARGAAVLVQDRRSSVVWGMPGLVARAGLAERVLDVDGLAAEVRARARVR